MTVRIGIDIGGTFTDVVAHTEHGFVSTKVPSTYPDPAPAVAAALDAILDRIGRTPADIAALAHGTTVATNAAIERTFATVGMLTTRGFRDVLAIGRQIRPELYNLHYQPTPPLVPRRLRREVDERVDYRGAVLVEPQRDQVLEQARALLDDGAETICVCFLNSYADPTHEDLVADWLRAAFPAVPVWTSARVVSEFREYERFSTTVLNAALGPVMTHYLARFARQTADTGVAPQPTLMHSAGGVSRLEEAAQRPTSTLLSGPAAGVLGAVRIGQQLGERNLLTFDMGGTSTDLSVVRDGEAEMLRLRTVEGYPVLGSTLAISTIGAGGGSIAWTDSGGRLRVGPRSAGARPGPAAYGHGGTEPTVTDAHVVIGTLPASLELGHSVVLDRDAAVLAMEKIAQPLGLTMVEAAHAVLDVVNTNMALAARQATVARGIDPRDHLLVAFGGAGPLHAVDLARQLSMDRVLIPATPGTMCALGLLVSDLRTEFTRTRLIDVHSENLPEINEIWAELRTRAQAWIQEQDREASSEVSHRADVRYRGQDHSLTVAVPTAPWTPAQIEEVLTVFRRAHLERNGYAAEDEDIEIENFRVIPSIHVGGEAADEPGIVATSGARPLAAAKTTPIWWTRDSAAATPVFDRAELPVGSELMGPALVLQEDTTLVVPPGASVTVQPDGSLVCLSWALDEAGALVPAEDTTAGTR
ncbi:hydantoinase/oxoprolinase family protein [Amycolatopsis thermoflava]|uniref:N-methylhydantoinase A n=1 Tax=Amycolatopsis thermoflava TaxID=84480 RepID=A0A3N2GPE3_9PSEU|nr:hydantoinase/oxoprolinase family protein [Amycolatopsis thermoflava]ROS38487.1 N-methylhydantoinase A [Amycolatopsis thermoflava]